MKITRPRFIPTRAALGAAVLTLASELRGPASRCCEDLSLYGSGQELVEADAAPFYRPGSHWLTPAGVSSRGGRNGPITRFRPRKLNHIFWHGHRASRIV